MPRRKKSDMSLMPIAQQQDLQQRLANRRDVEEAVKRLLAALAEFLDHDKEMIKEFAARFQASGHLGQYHENPSDTARRRQLAAKVRVRLKETPLNWMGAIELSYNLQRIDTMAEFLQEATQEEVSLQDILIVYQGIGSDIRQRVYAEMGHWPEKFPIPSDRITGEESDDLFKLADYQPPLF